MTLPDSVCHDVFIEFTPLLMRSDFARTAAGEPS
jgi:hypothetical protein